MVSNVYRKSCLVVVSTILMPILAPAAESQGPREIILSGKGNEVPSYVTVISGRKEPERISYTTAAFNYFMQVAGDPNPERVKENIRSTLKIDDGKASSFLNYAKFVVEDSKAFGAILAKKMCDKREQLTTVSRLAEAMNEVDAQVLMRREELIRDTEKVIGARSMGAFEFVIVKSNQSNLTVMKTDYEKWMIDTKQDPKDLLAKNCAQLQ